MDQHHADVLVVAHQTAATPALLAAISERAEQSPARFHLLVPNPAAHAELTDAERARHHREGELMLAVALPLIEEAAGAPADGSVSIRHDPMDAVEEALGARRYDEIIVATLPHTVAERLHLDLPHRLAHLGLPVTTVVARDRDQKR